jgi:protein involved in polysaccharide export with SLBB domain
MAVAVLTASAVAACVPTTPKVTLVPASALAADHSPYEIQEGDTLDIRFLYTPELNDTVLVRPDGKISVAYINDVDAVDVTPDVLRDRLKAAYAGILHNPVITVVLKTSTATRVFVGGEVTAPGEFAFPGRGTLIQYLTKAGGIKTTGAGNRVMLIRRGPKGEPQLSILDADAVLNGSSTVGDVALKTYDVVYVPPNTITEIDRFADQYLRQIVPVNFSATYTLP